MDLAPGMLEGETPGELVVRYNYDEFAAPKFEPWMRFAESPALLTTAPDHPLTVLSSGTVTTLPELCRDHAFTVVEFGSFT